MDPCNLTLECFSLLGILISTSKVVKEYAATYNNTRVDLQAVIRELAEFEMLTEILEKDKNIASGQSRGPVNIQAHIFNILKDANNTMVEMQTLLSKYPRQSTGQSAWWMLSGNREMTRLQNFLSRDRSALALALNISHSLVNQRPECQGETTLTGP